MPAHKYADLMLEYAKDAAKTDKPWDLWQFRSAKNGDWKPIGAMGSSWVPEFEYRRKPDPYQRWINVFDDGSTEDFSSREAAVNEADSYGRENYSRVAIHMKEVE